MIWQLWVLALAVIIANLPSVIWYGVPAAKTAGTDRERWGMAMYVVTRSVALMTSAVIGVALNQSGIVIGVAIASILVQAMDIPIALRRRRPAEAVGAGFLALMVLAAILAYTAYVPELS